MMDEADVFSITTITTCAKAGTAVELAALVEALAWTDVGSSPVPRCPQSPIVTSKAAATPAVDRDMATRARRPEFTVAFFHHGHGCIKDVAVSFSMFGDVKPETRRNRSPQPRLQTAYVMLLTFSYESVAPWSRTSTSIEYVPGVAGVTQVKVLPVL